MPYESIQENSPTTSPATGPATGTGVSHVTVGPDGGGQRIDNWLLRELKGVPRSRIYRILRKGEVRVNGKRAKPEYRVVAGDDIRLPPVRTPTEQGPARVPDRALADIESSVVYEDKDLLVIAKASGVAVHGGSGLSFGVIEALRASRPSETLELVHRLDRDTSGLLMVARNRTALRALHGLLRDGLVEKQYLALVQGSWNLGTKTIDVPLETRARQGGERVVKVQAGGKESQSTFTPVDFFGATATLLQVSIGTGRTHQIRVHAAHAGHPVAGDDKYGDREFNAWLATVGLNRMFLHAQTLSFEWPGSGKVFSLSVPLTPELVAIIDHLTAERSKRSSRRRR
jgi:23S rRNA pseudouridine955/2504/2580 synthase